MQMINRVDVLSVAKVLGCLYGLFGLIFGALFALLSLVGAGMGQEGALGVLLGAGAIVLLPILYGVAGFVGGALTGWLYNVCSGIVGGIEVELS